MTDWGGFQQLGLKVGQESIQKRYFALKRVLLTGASSGIGRACGIWLLNQGARVALVGRNIEELTKIGEQFPNQAIAVKCDLAIDLEQYDMVRSVVESFGGLDILINAAGVVFDDDTEHTYPQDHDYLVDINLRSIYHISQLCQSFLEKSKGCIVNISSVWGNKPAQGMTSYCMTKAGLEMLTKCLALEMNSVRVNAVAPGFVNTNYFANAGVNPLELKKISKRLKEANPMKKTVWADDIVKAIVFLCSDRASNITGQVLRVDGGQHLTSSLYTHWDSTPKMNSKYFPTGVKLVERMTGWVSKQLGREEEHGTEWLMEQESKSNWSTNLADAHLKVSDNYSKLENEQHVIAGLGQKKDEEGTIYTAENPKPARFIQDDGSSSIGSPVKTQISPTSAPAKFK